MQSKISRWWPSDWVDLEQQCSPRLRGDGPGAAMQSKTSRGWPSDWVDLEQQCSPRFRGDGPGAAMQSKTSRGWPSDWVDLEQQCSPRLRGGGLLTGWTWSSNAVQDFEGVAFRNSPNKTSFNTLNVLRYRSEVQADDW
ncbi:hypothetical protein DPMN_084023 [Dreissena polymorpha]|uniref:Uncharacterized protein n=1 Tax=Dreissena polymorpha TaxID=45954 RepID=A0A9D3YB06_DREPO|nr:hypothetical protein DPMN_084023 [Dreissena polymorpha]